VENIKFAINYLIKNKYKLLEDDNNYGNQSIKMAIEALERQVPERIPDGGAFGYCPSCRQIFNSELRNEYVIEYCPWCGQRLDWRVEE
jgi:hypothetical protein